MGSEVRLDVGVEERGGEALGLGRGLETGLGVIVGVEGSISLPSHPMRANIKITAQAEVYIAFFMNRKDESTVPWERLMPGEPTSPPVRRGVPSPRAAVCPKLETYPFRG